jgi:hypothetical protein
MRIPQQYVVGLAMVARFSDNDIEQILPALSDPELHDVEQTAKSLSKRLPYTSDEIERA